MSCKSALRSKSLSRRWSAKHVLQVGGAAEQVVESQVD